MVDYREFKDSLKNLDKDVRMCLLYLEQSIQDKYKAIVVPPPKVDFSPLERRMQSVEQRMDNLQREKDDLQNLRKYILEENKNERNKVIETTKSYLELMKMLLEEMLLVSASSNGEEKYNALITEIEKTITKIDKDVYGLNGRLTYENFSLELEGKNLFLIKDGIRYPVIETKLFANGPRDAYLIKKPSGDIVFDVEENITPEDERIYHYEDDVCIAIFDKPYPTGHSHVYWEMDETLARLMKNVMIRNPHEPGSDYKKYGGRDYNQQP